ncbi:DUF4136 domain-containing protein [Catalinimonas sp. 4WD22]|uniref:DUF4136 domain-containing protein n=1 Tax=Catalinimonas locisalis TaxID=3133978 RepID=UPI0031014C3B
MKRRFHKALLLFALTSMCACYPEGPEYVEDLDVVYTNYDPEFAFSAQNTFAVPDSIILISEQNFVVVDGDDTPEIVDPVYADVILEQLRENMVESGWTETEIEDDPDVILLLSVTRTTNLYYNYDLRYWDWWYPGSYAGLGWYYPNYFPGYYRGINPTFGYSPGYVSGYRSGSLLIQMTQPANTGVNDNVPVVWMGVVNGLLEGSPNNINNRLQLTINQAFDQSPYLNI